MYEGAGKCIKGLAKDETAFDQKMEMWFLEKGNRYDVELTMNNKKWPVVSNVLRKGGQTAEMHREAILARYAKAGATLRTGSGRELRDAAKVVKEIADSSGKYRFRLSMAAKVNPNVYPIALEEWKKVKGDGFEPMMEKYADYLLETTDRVSALQDIVGLSGPERASRISLKVLDKYGWSESNDRSRFFVRTLKRNDPQALAKGAEEIIRVAQGSVTNLCSNSALGAVQLLETGSLPPDLALLESIWKQLVKNAFTSGDVRSNCYNGYQDTLKMFGSPYGEVELWTKRGGSRWTDRLMISVNGLFKSRNNSLWKPPLIRSQDAAEVKRQIAGVTGLLNYDAFKDQRLGSLLELKDLDFPNAREMKLTVDFKYAKKTVALRYFWDGQTMEYGDPWARKTGTVYGWFLNDIRIVEF